TREQVLRLVLISPSADPLAFRAPMTSSRFDQFRRRDALVTFCNRVTAKFSTIAWFRMDSIANIVQRKFGAYGPDRRNLPRPHNRARNAADKPLSHELRARRRP